jgi:trimeric autotransporter adhesin
MGSHNIDIGNKGVAAESGTIRIGTKSTQTATFIEGIFGTSVTGSAVVVNSHGQLGVTVSSERYKTASRT